MLTLQREYDAYKAHLPELLAGSEGKFVVIVGDRVEHISGSYEEALNWAYDHFGLARFFVKQVLAQEPVAHSYRDLRPCGA